MIQQSRRGFLIGLGAIVAAPAIVRASSLMPIKAMRDMSFEEMSAANYSSARMAMLELWRNAEYQRAVIHCIFASTTEIPLVAPRRGWIDPVRQ